MKKYFENVNNVQLKLFGNGEQSRSFTYIDDVTELLSMCTDLNSNCTLNVGNNKTSTLNEVIKLI